MMWIGFDWQGWINASRVEWKACSQAGKTWNMTKRTLSKSVGWRWREWSRFELLGLFRIQMCWHRVGLAKLNPTKVELWRAPGRKVSLDLDSEATIVGILGWLVLPAKWQFHFSVLTQNMCSNSVSDYLMRLSLAPSKPVSSAGEPKYNEFQVVV